MSKSRSRRDAIEELMNKNHKQRIQGNWNMALILEMELISKYNVIYMLDEIVNEVYFERDKIEAMMNSGCASSLFLTGYMLYYSDFYAYEDEGGEMVYRDEEDAYKCFVKASSLMLCSIL